MPNTVDYRSFNGRVDFQASARHRFFVRWLKSSFLEGAGLHLHDRAGPDELGRETSGLHGRG